MGLFSWFNRSEKRSTGGDYLPQHLNVFGPSGYNDTGVSITEANALISSTVFACVSIIAQTISTLPVHVIGRNDGEKDRDHPLYRLLAHSPNPYMTPASFLEAVLNNALLYGGAYAAVERDSLGYPIAFYPLRSGDVTPTRRAGVLLFEVRIGSRLFTLTQDQVVFVLGWTLDGITPVSPVKSASQSLGLDVAMSRYAGKAFSGGNIGGILQTPPMSPQAMTDFVTSWREKYTGVDNAFKIAVLPDPMKFIPTTLKPQEGQLIEARQAQVIEVCRWWKVPPALLGVLERSSYASLEQQNMAFYQQCILPWLVKLEQAFSLVGFLEREKPELELKFNADALLRGTTQERYTAYMSGRQAGFLSINDIRRKEGWPPVEGGDAYLTPLNMQPIGGSTGNRILPAPNDTTAARQLVEDAFRRLLVKESKALLRFAKKPKFTDELRAWGETFYANHAALVTQVIASPLKAAGITTSAEEVARRHCDESRRLLTSIIEGRASADDVADEWQDIRPAQSTDELIEGK